jgi:hypothetical protein
MNNPARSLTQRILFLSLAVAAIFAGAGCHGIRASTDNATLKTGLRYDQDGRLTDEPEVSVPVWSSKGLKAKPENVTPAKE